MRAAIEAAAAVRTTTSPNPWVGAVVVDAGGQIIATGATQPPGGAHAEREALRLAGPAAAGATLVTHARAVQPPRAHAAVHRGDHRRRDPPRRRRDRGSRSASSAGRAWPPCRAAGIDVTVGVEADAVSAQLAPYLTHRRTGRPYVVLKLAATIDGRTAAPDGTSQWITGEAARADAHRLRAESDAVLVGAGTVRSDDPALTVRHVAGRDPLRVVLGRAPAGARVHPCLELSGDLGAVLDDLGRRGVLQLLVEGGPTVAHAFHAAGLVDRYVVYLAPAVFGGDDALGLFRGPAAPSIDVLPRGTFTSVCRLGDDVRLDLLMERGDG